MRALTVLLLTLLPIACSRSKPVKPGEQTSGLFLIHKGGRAGFIDRSGKIVIESQFDDAAPFSDGLAVISLANRAGYIDERGRIVVNPQFESGAPFSEGLAAVRQAGLWGFIDKSGKMVINPQFHNPGNLPITFAESRAVVARNAGGPVGFIDKTGRMAIPAQYAAGLPFSEGFALVATGSAWGYIDDRGKVVIRPQFSEASSFAGDLAAVRLGDRWGYVDKAGKYVINPQFDAARVFSGDLALVGVGGRYGYIDRKGRYVINPQFDLAGDFSDGLAPVKLGAKWGYIDKEGNWVIEPQFNMAWPFSEGLARASTVRDGLYGYIDKNGDWVIEPQFDNALDFSEGLAAVQVTDTGLFGFIDTSGKFVIQPSFDLDFNQYANRPAYGIFSNGLAAMKLDADEASWGYIDKAGKVVWRTGTSGSADAGSQTSAAGASASTTTEPAQATTTTERPRADFLYLSVLSRGHVIVQTDGKILDIYGNEYVGSPWGMDFSDSGTVIHQDSKGSVWLSSWEGPEVVLQSPEDPSKFDTAEERIKTAVISRDGSKILAQFDQKAGGYKLKVMEMPDGPWRNIYESEVPYGWEAFTQPPWKPDSNLDYILLFDYYYEERPYTWYYDYSSIKLISVDDGDTVVDLADANITHDLENGIVATADGSKIAYIRSIEPRDQIVVYDVKTGVSRVVGEAGHYKGGDIHKTIDHLRWSPDGTGLIATIWTGETGYQIHLFSEDGNPTDLTQNDSDRECYMGAWSPDGSRIAFHSTDGDSKTLWIMDRDGSNKTLVATAGVSGERTFMNWRTAILPDLEYVD